MTEHKITDGNYRIRNVATCLLLEVPGGSRRSGVKVLLAPEDGSDAQLWRLTAVHPGGALFHVENVAGGKRLDVTGAATDNGVPVQQWSANAFGAQEWLVEHHLDAPGTCTLTSFVSGKALTAPAAPSDQAAPPTPVHQWEDTDSPTQWWHLERQ
ncbi:RICIN domain-containing protein [Kitasatospora purpeofusca]|uniref:RICIN domain-containing protein n=1 Tax=Kitasatospora purpeofusca TaxID=67352 RepID=UPI00225B2073|nr:RICIN domain-containing protein [Kitasatospora purpeofusca]MCX4753802.1 RICIN domain-containing protein [Kitasatospora purpeofusca]WSR33279.1 RICIN domain-containing protein [Kitasatospora purpeofusca]WSR41351.1 RICIN domain-containing protein [Kitasatospora purpeofusca]